MNYAWLTAVSLSPELGHLLQEGLETQWLVLAFRLPLFWAPGGRQPSSYLTLPSVSQELLIDLQVSLATFLILVTFFGLGYFPISSLHIYKALFRVALFYKWLNVPIFLLIISYFTFLKMTEAPGSENIFP